MSCRPAWATGKKRSQARDSQCHSCLHACLQSSSVSHRPAESQCPMERREQWSSRLRPSLSVAFLIPLTLLHTRSPRPWSYSKGGLNLDQTPSLKGWTRRKLTQRLALQTAASIDDSYGPTGFFSLAPPRMPRLTCREMKQDIGPISVKSPT